MNYIYHYLFYRWQFKNRIKTIDNLKLLLTNYQLIYKDVDTCITRDLINCLKKEIDR